MKPVYISGPMSGLPQFNFPAFKRAAEQLRSAGFKVVSPHEMDTPAMQEAAWASPNGDATKLPPGETWGTMLARDVQLIADQCGGIVLLHGWHLSRGARLEVVTGLLTGADFYLYSPAFDVTPIPREYVIDRLEF